MMKRSGVVVLAVVVLGSVAYLSRGSDGEPRKEASAGLKGKTAYLNLSYVIKGYAKYQRFTSETKDRIEKIEVRVKKLKGQLEAQVKEFSQPGVLPEDRKTGEKNARELQRQLEDLTVEGRELVSTSSAGMMVEIYKAIREATAAYARQEGLDAVLHYNDATPGTPEFYAPPNVQRKLQCGPTMPLYIAPGLDISEAILNDLNARDKDSEKDSEKERDADE